jgi:hypothetical protein
MLITVNLKNMNFNPLNILIIVVVGMLTGVFLISVPLVILGSPKTMAVGLIPGMVCTVALGVYQTIQYFRGK